jgi:hypothetical protein
MKLNQRCALSVPFIFKLEHRHELIDRSAAETEMLDADSKDAEMVTTETNCHTPNAETDPMEERKPSGDDRSRLNHYDFSSSEEEDPIPPMSASEPSSPNVSSSAAGLAAGRTNLSREERKIRDALLRFARMEQGQATSRRRRDPKTSTTPTNETRPDHSMASDDDEPPDSALSSGPLKKRWLTDYTEPSAYVEIAEQHVQEQPDVAAEMSSVPAQTAIPEVIADISEQKSPVTERNDVVGESKLPVKRAAEDLTIDTSAHAESPTMASSATTPGTAAARISFKEYQKKRKLG